MNEACSGDLGINGGRIWGLCCWMPSRANGRSCIHRLAEDRNQTIRFNDFLPTRR